MSTPRLCMIIQQLGLAGRELAVLNLSEGLAQRGWEVEVIAFRPLWPGVTDRVPLEHTQVQILNCGTKMGRVRAIAAHLRRRRPLIVHTHMFSAGAYGRPAAFLARVPVLIQTHGGPLFCDTRWKHVPVERLLSCITDRVVSVSHSLADHLVGTGGLDARRIQVVPNGIGDASLLDIPLRERSTYPTLLSVGRLFPYKGWDVLFDALALCRDADWTLNIIGFGVQERTLRDQVDRLKLTDRVNFAGSQTRLLPWFEAADIYVSPSRTEGMSNALLEAMAAGLPAVATAVAGSDEVLSGAGWVVPPDDPQALAGAIREALEQPRKARRYAEKARARVRGKFSMERVVLSHENLYTECLAARGITL